MKDKSLFGTSGIRGHAETLFTDQFCFDIGRSFAIFLKDNGKSGSVAIGGDPRDSTPRIKKSFSSGLIHEGLKVIDQAVVPIPAINYILKADPPLAGSVMVSGSHIKSELNGLKFFAFGEEILKNHEAKINEIYLDNKEKVSYQDKSDQIIQNPKAKDFYINYLLKYSKQPYPKWSIVVDPGNGAQSEVMPYVLEKCGLRVIAVNNSTSENFMARDTEVETDFEGLKKAVIEAKADFGVGYDSDGDRAVFVDETGTYIPGDYTGSLIARGSSGENIVTPISTSLVVDQIGKKVFRTKVGSPYVVEKMKEIGANFGFEANGGGIFSEMRSRDGGRTTMAVLNILAQQNKLMSEVISELPKFYIVRDKVEYKWELKDKIIDEAKKLFTGIKVEELDGLKIWIDENTWILFRSSANAPEFRVFAESKEEAKAKKLLEDGISLVKRVIGQ